MSSLKAIQEEMKNLIFYREPEKKKSYLWKDQIPARMDVYRQNTRLNWSDALEHDFPLTRQQFDDEKWQTLKHRYFIQHPPKHWELNTAMTPFTKFLATQKVSLSIRELADYEWCDLQIFISQERVRPGSGLTNPTLVVRVFQHQIFDWVQAGTPKEKPPRSTPEVLAFYRDSKNACHIEEADPLMLLMFDHFKKPGARLDDLETIRHRLLPQNDVPLATVFSALRSNDLLL